MALPRPLLGAVVATAVLAGVLTSCSSSSPGTTDGTLSVVTSTNVYGNLAAEIGGSDVTVTSFISDAGQDPHSYEASAHDELTLSRADVVIENGGGYDDFMDDLLRSAGGHGTLIDVVQLSGHTAPAGGELNEHVWYDFATVEKLVDKLVSVLSAADHTHAAAFAAHGRSLLAGLHKLEATETTLRAAHRGEGVAITEPVPLYLLSACGLVDRTPATFSEAVEAGTGVPAAVLQQTLDLFTTHAVRALVYNSQTSGPETDQVVAAAKQAGVAVVPVTETMPSGLTYLSWMSANLAALTQALS